MHGIIRQKIIRAEFVDDICVALTPEFLGISGNNLLIFFLKALRGSVGHVDS
jgi:hypothetical protein